MVERTPNLTKTVAWFLEKKALIKFSDDEKSYKLAENVIKANNFEKFPIRKGDVVEIGLTADAITFLRKAKSQAPKDEGKGSEEAYEPTPEEEAPKVAPAPEVKKEVVTPSDVKELTVFAVAANKKVVKFTELKDDGWFQIDPSIQAKDYTEIGLIAKNKAKVQLSEKNVVSFEKVDVVATQSTQEAPSEVKNTPTTTATPAPLVKKEYKPYNAQESDARQRSIEAQAAVNAANDTVSRIAAQIDPKPTALVINAMIRAIAESNFALIQELKSK